MMQENADDRSFDLRRALVDHGVSLGLILLVVFLAYQVFAPLFPSILWGLLLAVICAHPYERLVSRLKGRRAIADVVFAVLLLLVLILPALFFAWELVVNFPVLSEWLHTAHLPEPPPWIADLPVIGPTLKEALGAGITDFGEKIPNIASHLGGLASWAAIRIGTFGAFLAEFLLGTVVALFILHNRFAVRAFVNRLLSKTGGAFAGGLFARALDTTRTAFAGVVYASIVQTLLAVVGLYAAGLPALVLFAGFTFILALIQVGPLVILIVADTILLIEGAYIAATLLTIWFLVVVMTSDNLIRPYFSSQGSELPGIVAFLGTVGGFLSWGLIGVFLGPVLTSVLYEMLLAWLDKSPAIDGDNNLET